MKEKIIIYTGECGEFLVSQSNPESIVRKIEKIMFVLRMVLL
jgi:hypothetical protein